MKKSGTYVLVLLMLISGCKPKVDVVEAFKDPRATYSFNPYTEGNVSMLLPGYIDFLKDPNLVFEVFNQPKRSVKDPNDITVLVNREFYVDQDYVPADLVSFAGRTNGSEQLLRAETAESLLNLFNKGLEMGHEFIASSAYRSYQMQQRIYQNYANLHGAAKANTFSALAGHSEHQLGLAVDISSSRFNGVITGLIRNTPEGRWLKANAHFYGFIIRYTNQNQYITGYIDEPWHLRYVGADLASYLYHTTMTLEQYFYGIQLYP